MCAAEAVARLAPSLRAPCISARSQADDMPDRRRLAVCAASGPAPRHQDSGIQRGTMYRGCKQ
eukprot:1648499-Prymnesium_polylepis.1